MSKPVCVMCFAIEYAARLREMMGAELSDNVLVLRTTLHIAAYSLNHLASMRGELCDLHALARGRT